MIQIFNKDCLDVMKELGSDSVNLILTDPPYLIDYKTSRRKDKTHRFCNTIKNDNNPLLISEYIKESHRVLKNNSAMYMFCNSVKVDFFKQELEKYFIIKNMIIWVKNNHTAGDLKNAFGKKYEIIFLVNKGLSPYNGVRHTDIWEFNKVSGKINYIKMKNLSIY